MSFNDVLHNPDVFRILLQYLGAVELAQIAGCTKLVRGDALADDLWAPLHRAMLQREFSLGDNVRLRVSAGPIAWQYAHTMAKARFRRGSPCVCIELSSPLPDKVTVPQPSGAGGLRTTSHGRGRARSPTDAALGDAEAADKGVRAAAGWEHGGDGPRSAATAAGADAAVDVTFPIHSIAMLPSSAGPGGASSSTRLAPGCVSVDGAGRAVLWAWSFGGAVKLPTALSTLDASFTFSPAALNACARREDRAPLPEGNALVLHNEIRAQLDVQKLRQQLRNSHFSTRSPFFKLKLNFPRSVGGASTDGDAIKAKATGAMATEGSEPSSPSPVPLQLQRPGQTPPPRQPRRRLLQSQQPGSPMRPPAKLSQQSGLAAPPRAAARGGLMGKQGLRRRRSSSENDGEHALGAVAAKMVLTPGQERNSATRGSVAAKVHVAPPAQAPLHAQTVAGAGAAVVAGAGTGTTAAAACKAAPEAVPAFAVPDLGAKALGSWGAGKATKAGADPGPVQLPFALWDECPVDHDSELEHELSAAAPPLARPGLYRAESGNAAIPGS
eukprot:g4479.t1